MYNNPPVQYMATGGALSSPYANPMRTQMQSLGGGISSLAPPQMAPAFEQQMAGQGMAPPTGMGQENIEPNFVNGPGGLVEKGAGMGPRGPETTDYANMQPMGPGSMGQGSFGPPPIPGMPPRERPNVDQQLSNYGTMGPGSMGGPPMQGVGGLFSEMNQGPSGGGGQPLGSYRSYLTDTYSKAQQEALSSRVNDFVDLVGRAEQAHFGNQGR